MFNLLTSKEKIFWKWFQEHQHSLAMDELLQSELVTKLHDYCDQLSFEIGQIGNNKYDFVITAGGNTNYFNKIQSLVKQAPDLLNWTITAFKQPQERKFTFEYSGISINTDEIWFEPLENKKQWNDIGLLIFVKGYSQFKRIDFLKALDITMQTILGEESFSRDIKYYEIATLPEDYEEYISIIELPEYILWHKNRK